MSIAPLGLVVRYSLVPMLIVDLKDSAELKRRKNNVFIEFAEDTLPNALTITIIIIIVSIRRLTPTNPNQKLHL